MLADPQSTMTRPAASRRMLEIQPPVIPIVGELIRARPGTISLAQGVVYYPPPPGALTRIPEFLERDDGRRYGPVQGMPALIGAIRHKLRRENGIDVDVAGQRIVVTAGGNMAFLNALLAITDPGDEVILPLPYYFNHEMAVRMVDCRPVFVSTDIEYQIDVDRLRAAVTPRTRAIVTVSPNNPSGAVYPRATLSAVNALCRDSDIYHISDEAYENFVHAGDGHFSPAGTVGSGAHTISLFSLSKSHALAGWRVGYMTVPAHLYESILKVQDTNLICANLLAQDVATACIERESAYRDEKIAVLNGVRREVLNILAEIGPGCTCSAATGAFYVLLRLDSPMTPMAVVRRLIEDDAVAVLPGDAFGLEGCHLRVSYGALDPQTVIVGMERLVRGLRKILA